MSTATRLGFCGSTNRRWLVIPRGSRSSLRFGEASQCLVSFTLWCTITVGMCPPGVPVDRCGQLVAYFSRPADWSSAGTIATR